MNGEQGAALIACLCALILVGSAALNRRVETRSMLLMLVFWGALIVLGVAVAKLWLTHHNWPR